MKKSLGIYLHIPFCVQKCRYCDFCSFPKKGEKEKNEYTVELCRRIKTYRDRVDGYAVDTVYFGGGTPSLMSIADIEKIMAALYTTFDIVSEPEITFECNPATADREYFSALRSMGINRLSMGLQSALDSELTLLGRIHSFKDFQKTFCEAREADFDNISSDVMYGIPNQTVTTFEQTLAAVTKMRPDHISAYGLTVEEGTYFHRHKNELILADDDMQYEMYRLCGDFLGQNGYAKYEISNFALSDDKRSRHNLRYWQGKEYLGFGVAAHSFFGGERFGNSRDVAAFLRGEDITVETERVSGENRRKEYVMLRMRLSEGIDLDCYSRLFEREIAPAEPFIESCVKGGLIRQKGSRIAFTDDGFFISNALICELMDLL